MNMFKKNGGFTLVELIVVIAILAILAGIAVPAYSGYVAKAEKTQDIAKLEAVQTAALSAASLNATNGEVKITTDANGLITKVEVGTTQVYPDTNANVEGIEDDFADFYSGNDYQLKLDDYKGKAITESAEGWIAGAIS